jgi:hypothetical protein
MASYRSMRRRVRLDDDGRIHVATTRYIDDLLTSRWDEMVLDPDEALDFFRSGLVAVEQLCPGAASQGARTGSRRGA